MINLSYFIHVPYIFLYTRIEDSLTRLISQSDDVCTMLPCGKWVNDRVINAFFLLVMPAIVQQSTCIAQPGTTRKCCFTDSFFYSCLKKKGNRHSFNARYDCPAQEHVLIFPIHVNGNHWVCCVIDPTALQFWLVINIYGLCIMARLCVPVFMNIQSRLLICQGAGFVALCG